MPWSVILFSISPYGWFTSLLVLASGQDNTNALCEIGTVPNLFVGDEDDHSGPYDGVTMGC